MLFLYLETTDITKADSRQRNLLPAEDKYCIMKIKERVPRELRVLRYSLMAASEENITKTSALLHIAQPTLSQRMMLLEGELEPALFRWDKHSIVQTEDGMLLKRRVQELIS